VLGIPLRKAMDEGRAWRQPVSFRENAPPVIQDGQIVIDTSGPGRKDWNGDDSCAKERIVAWRSFKRSIKVATQARMGRQGIWERMARMDARAPEGLTAYVEGICTVVKGHEERTEVPGGTESRVGMGGRARMPRIFDLTSLQARRRASS